MSKCPSKAFTLVELLSVVAIIAALISAATYFTASYVAWAKQTADHQTFAVLNDALNRYKSEGGCVNALTVGAPISNVLASMQKQVLFAGNLPHQFLKTGFTYPARSLQAMGNGQQYQFYQVGSYTGITPPTGSFTSNQPYGNGVIYMANDGVTAYSFTITTVLGSNYFAVLPSGAATPTIYASGATATVAGTYPSVTTWACAGASNSTQLGDIGTLVATGTRWNGTNNLTAINVKGSKTLWILSCGGNLITSLDVSYCTALQQLDCTRSPQLASLNIHGCSIMYQFACYMDPMLTGAFNLKTTGSSNFTYVDASNCGFTSIDASGFPTLPALHTYNNAVGCQVNVTGDKGLPLRSTNGSTGFWTSATDVVTGP